MTTNEPQPQQPLSDEQRSLASELQAMLNAYDLADPAEQAKMHAAMRGETPDYMFSEQQLQAGYAVTGVERANPDKTHEQALRDVNALQADVTELPAARGVLRWLGRLGRRNQK